MLSRRMRLPQRRAGPPVLLVRPNGLSNFIDGGPIVSLLPGLSNKIRSTRTLDMMAVIQRSSLVHDGIVAPEEMERALRLILIAIDISGKEARKLKLVKALETRIRHSHPSHGYSRFHACLDLFCCLAELSRRYDARFIGQCLSLFFLANVGRIIPRENRHLLPLWGKALDTAHMSEGDFGECMIGLLRARPSLLRELMHHYPPGQIINPAISRFIKQLRNAEVRLQKGVMGFRPRQGGRIHGMAMPLASPAGEFGPEDFVFPMGFPPPRRVSPSFMLPFDEDGMSEFEDVDDFGQGFPFPAVPSIGQALSLAEEGVDLANQAIANVRQQMAGGALLENGISRGIAMGNDLEWT